MGMTIEEFDGIRKLNDQIANLQAERNNQEIKIMEKYGWDYPRFEQEYNNLYF